MDCAHSINDSHTVVRHIRKNYGIGANADIIPNLYPSDYLHTGSDIYIISDDGGSRSLTIRQCIIAKFICTDCKIQMCIFS